MEIRFASSNDIEQIKVLKQKLQAIHHDARPDIFSNTNIDDFTVTENTLVVEHNKEIIAFSSFVLLYFVNQPLMTKRKIMEIDYIYVSEEYQNMRIGHNLFKELKTIAKQNECESINLLVWSFNKKAINFYEKENMKTTCSKYELKL